MSARWVLQHLYSLDPSSVDFLCRLHYLIWCDEKEQYLTSLQGSELAQLTNFIDKVHAVPSAFHQFTKQTPQALGVIPITEDATRECLNKLQAICSDHKTLPPSHIIDPGEITRVGGALEPKPPPGRFFPTLKSRARNMRLRGRGPNLLRWWGFRAPRENDCPAQTPILGRPDVKEELAWL